MIISEIPADKLAESLTQFFVQHSYYLHSIKECKDCGNANTVYKYKATLNPLMYWIVINKKGNSWFAVFEGEKGIHTGRIETLTHDVTTRKYGK